MLGSEDRGIFTFMINFEFEGGGQGFGGYVLGGEYTNTVIKGILYVVGVDKWEDLKGKYVRIEGEKFGPINRMGNLIEDKWFDPEAK